MLLLACMPTEPAGADDDLRLWFRCKDIFGRAKERGIKRPEFGSSEGGAIWSGASARPRPCRTGSRRSCSRRSCSRRFWPTGAAPSALVSTGAGLRSIERTAPRRPHLEGRIPGRACPAICYGPAARGSRNVLPWPRTRGRDMYAPGHGRVVWRSSACEDFRPVLALLPTMRLGDTFGRAAALKARGPLSRLASPHRPLPHQFGRTRTPCLPAYGREDHQSHLPGR